MFQVLKVVVGICCGNPFITLVIEVIYMIYLVFEGGDGSRGVGSIT